jgi:hypothetical protein
MFDRGGEKIGRIEEIYLDQETDLPEWALVHTGLFGVKSTFVPIAQASPTDDGVRVPFEKSQVQDAPHIDPEGELSRQQEGELYAHYGMDYGDLRSPSGLPEDDVAAADPSDEERGVSDEEPGRAEERGEPGRGRLRRYVT